MNPGAVIGWGLAVAAVAVGYAFYGWRGVALAVSGVVFWLLLQFSRSLQAMRAAAGAPIGHVPSAVMLQARLHKGQRLMDLLKITRSLGEKLGDSPETYRWADPSGHSVQVALVDGRVTAWTFSRAADAADDTPAA